MPAMGPDMDAARRQGREVGEKLLADLIDQHRLFDITDERYTGKGVVLPAQSQERWKAAKEAFVEAVGELFSEDSANSF